MLIAYRCKKDFSSRQNGEDCPSQKVKTRLRPELWGGIVYCPKTWAPDLNSICLPCPEWDPLHEKPLRHVSDSCRLSDTAQCPSWPEVRRTALVSPSKVPLMDALCSTCKLYRPS
jgi:hypothetical protein